MPRIERFGAGGGVNFAASNTTYTSGTVVLSGVANLTVSTNGQTIELSAAAGGTGGSPFTGGVSNIGNTAGDTGTVSNRLILAGGNRITLSASTAAAGQTITISGPNAQTAISGVVASDATYTSGTVTISGVGGGVTVNSNTGQRVDISVAAPVAQTNQAGSVYAVGNSTSTSSGTYDARTLSIRGDGIISVAASNSGFRISATQSVQPGIQNVIASDATFSSGTVSISGFGAATVNTAANIIRVSVPTQTVQPGVQHLVASDNTFSSGTVSITGTGGGVTVNTAASKIQISVAAPVAQSVQTQSNIQSIAASDTTYHTGQVQFTGSNMVTVKSSANQRVVIDATQSVQTQGGFLSVGASNAGNTSGDTGVTTGSRLVFAGGNNVTVSQGTAAGATTLTISAFNQSVQTQNLHNVTLSGNTSGAMAHISSGTLTLAGGNNITLSQAGNAVTISAPNLGAGAMSAGASNLGNTAGDTGITGTQLVLVGSNNITLSQTTGANGGTLSIIGGGGGGFSAGVSNQGNTAGDTGMTATRMVLAGYGAATLSQATGANGNTVSITMPQTSSLSATGGVSISTNGSTISIGVPHTKMHVFENFPRMQASLYTHIASISKTPFYWYEQLPGAVTLNSIAYRVSHVTNNTLQSFDVHFGVYTLVNSTSAALVQSFSERFNVSSASSASFTGQRLYVLTQGGTATGISNLTPGGYLFGMMFSAGATASMNQSLYGASVAAGQELGAIFPGNNQFSTATSQGVFGMHGRGSTTVNAMPANVVRSELVNQGSGVSVAIRPWLLIRS